MDKKNSNGTEKKFGYEWNIYREIIPLHKNQFLGWITPLDLSVFKGKRFLDAGCGIGRNSLWPLQAGASSAVAFDFDERSVDVARTNLKDYPHCQVTFRSIYELPFKNEFDIAFCVGVLHHLEHPRLALEKLVEAVKPNGLLILWVYAREGNENFLRWFDPIRALFTSRIHPFLTRIIAKICTVFLEIYIRFPHTSPYLALLRERSFRHNEAMVFDQLLPNISNYWEKSEVEALFKGLPVRITHLTHTHGVSWSVIAEKL